MGGQQQPHERGEYGGQQNPGNPNQQNPGAYGGGHHMGNAGVVGHTYAGSQQQQMGRPQQADGSKPILTPVQAYTPDPQQTGQSFLQIREDLRQQIEVILYNSNGSGWSYGRDVQSGCQGWFPTSCCHFDVVTTMYGFDTKPEQTRPYIQFVGDAKIVVEKRHDSGWWIGSVIESDMHGNLGPKGYFPGNYCREAQGQGTGQNQGEPRKVQQQ